MSRAKHITLVEGYRPSVRLKPGVECNLEKHYRGILRRVVSKLDLLAGNNSHRFVYVTIPALTKMCTKFEKGEPTGESYAERSVKYALAFLRRQGIISPPCTMDTDGGMRRGFCVIEHAEIGEPGKHGCGISPWRRPSWKSVRGMGTYWEVNPRRVFEPLK